MEEGLIYALYTAVTLAVLAITFFEIPVYTIVLLAILSIAIAFLNE